MFKTTFSQNAVFKHFLNLFITHYLLPPPRGRHALCVSYSKREAKLKKEKKNIQNFSFMPFK